MGYSIQYSPQTNHKFPVKTKKKVSVPWLLTGVALLALLLGGWKLLLPGDPTVTANALSHLVEDVRSGDSVGEAVTAFCREIIDSEK